VITVGGGYITYEMTATSPAGTAFVRPVFFFDFVGSEGTMRAANIDNVVLGPANVVECFADITTDGTSNGMPDGLVTLSDFSFYLSIWALSDSAADITTAGACDPGMGGDGVDLSDFSCYLAEWSLGCP
ncbi:MAG: GC-type dockerin domain-anchored protein, partial [Planctomycetota bacterium]